MRVAAACANVARCDIRRADAALLNRATLTTSQRNPARKEHLIEAASLELPLDTSTSEDAPVPVRDGESMMCAVSDEIDADSKVVVLQVEISNEGVAVARVSWSGKREGWVRCAHLAKSEALEILAESSKEDLEEGRKLAAPACPVASQPVNYVGKNSGRVVWLFGRRQLRRASLGSLVGVDGAALLHPPLPARGFRAGETLPWRRLCERVS